MDGEIIERKQNGFYGRNHDLGTEYIFVTDDWKNMLRLS